MFKKYLQYFSDQTKRPQQITAVLVIVVVAAIGTYLLTGSRAATPYANLNAANGRLGGNAQQVQNCSGANSGSCVTFGCGGTANSITVCPGASHSLSSDFLGYNGDVPTGQLSNPALLPAVKALNPETIRGIDAGTQTNYFNWQTGQYFIDSSHVSWIVPGNPNPPFTLSDYANLLGTNNANAVFNLNIMTYCPVDNANPASTSQAGASCTPAQACGPNPSAYTTSCTSSSTDPTWGLNFQIAMLQKAQSMGISVKYIELGNELYDTSNADFVYYFPSVQDYINRVNAWIPVLKQDFPQAKIAIVGAQGNICQHAPGQSPNTGEPAWDQALFSGVHGEDAVVFHTYYTSNILSGGSVNNAQDLATLLSTATQDCISGVQNYRLNLLPNGVTAWITEWNLWIDQGVLEQGSWAQGLTEASYALDLANQPKVELINNHDLVSNQIWGSLFVNSGAFLTSVQNQTIDTPTPVPTTQQFGMTSAGFTLSALERSLHGATNTTPLSFSSNPNIANTSVPGLMGQSFIVNGKTNLYFVNLSPTSENINLGNLSGNYSVLQYASSPTNFVTGNSSISPTTSTATNTVTVPGYSVTSLVSP
ncbi:MAG TPA: hypothetical protein VFC50_00730 [Candidatus Dormibacteraeota bacterium]|nr:hypothetical protein [Candidatus Dormibacteraeota bacterium]